MADAPQGPVRGKPAVRRLDGYALFFRLPIIFWQLLFFVGPLIFMIAMSFFLVKNYRMVEAFEFDNWAKMLARGYFWDSYLLTFGLAALSTLVVTTLAFPASYALAHTTRLLQFPGWICALAKSVSRSRQPSQAGVGSTF
jgi:ABC-type spermidine/putrescine transport system permease subunit I